MEWIIYELVFFLFGLILTAGGVILNFAINDFVVGFGTQMDTGGFGFVINTTWAVLRDIFNLSFIFGLVFIGFKMILRIDDANSKRWLVSLVLAALLVNFSLFITKFVIDFSNIIAVEMINEGMSQPIRSGTATVFAPAEGDSTRVDISRSMKKVMNIDTVASKETIEEKKLPGGATKPSWGLIFGTMMVFMVGAFVFFSAGILLIVRAAVLILLMIVSPFLFIGMVFPGLKGAGSKLWKMLFTRALLAPLYITLLYITLWIVGDYTGSLEQGTSNLGGALTANGETGRGADTIATTLGPFIIVTAFLWMSLVAAQKIGAEGGNTAVKMGKSIGGAARKRVVRTAGGAAARGGGALARNTAGRMAYNAANSDRGKRRAAGGFVDRQIAGFYKKVGDTSFDGRSKSKSGNFGKGAKGGYSANQAAKEKAEKQRAKDVERNPYDENGNPKANFEEMRNNDMQYVKAKEAKDYHTEEKKKSLDQDNELNTLKAKLEGTVNDADKREIERKIYDREQVVENTFEAEFESTAKELGLMGVKEMEKELKSANTRLEGEYKYAYVDELKKTRQKENAMWTNLNQGSGQAGAVSGAAIGTMFAGPLGTVVGAAVGAAVGKAVTGSNAATAATQTATITKEYGKDGRKKVKDKGANDILNKIKKEVEKDDDGGGDSDDENKT